MNAAPSTRTAVQVQPNVTPMIDVMLVLLIVFMVAAPLLVAGMPAVPPQAVNLKAHPDDPADYTLGIDRDGQYYLNKRPIVAAALEPALRRLFATRPDDRVLYLRADRSLDYGVVHSAMAVAARSGARVVGLVAERRATGVR